MLTNFVFLTELYISLRSISQFAEVQVNIGILVRLFDVIVYQNIEWITKDNRQFFNLLRCCTISYLFTYFRITYLKILHFPDSK